MSRHRAIATLAFGILGITGLPIIGSLVAVLLGRGRTVASEGTSDVTAERYRRIGLTLGYFGLALAAIAIVTGLAVGLSRTV
jgi:hypothetical protein